MNQIQVLLSTICFRCFVVGKGLGLCYATQSPDYNVFLVVTRLPLPYNFVSKHF